MRLTPLVSALALVPVTVVSAAAQETSIREVSASERTLIPLHAKLRYSTMILLPDDEEILDVVCGDKDFWVISATQNIAHVKPAKAGAATNLNLVTTSGAIYSFLLTEGKSPEPDLKVYVRGDGTSPRDKPKYVSASQLTALQTALNEARAAIQTVRHETEEAVSTFKRQYPVALQFTFGTPKYERPFFVKSIWHDGEFTYIKSDAHELPALYELKDGQPSLVNFQVQNGTYVVPKVLDRGYLALGKDRYAFRQQGR
jgi:type IV secretory pathway VirB9-like protein